MKKKKNLLVKRLIDNLLIKTKNQEIDINGWKEKRSQVFLNLNQLINNYIQLIDILSF